MNMIQFKGVTKQFPSGTIAFSDLSFEIDEGEIVLITGPSGSGKTTIMKLMIGEYLPSQGEVLFDNQLINQPHQRHLHLVRRKIGVVFQDYRLIEEMNVWENIALPLLIQGEKESVIEERVTDLLKLVELTDKAFVFPKQLSGGEAQRISIARALANSPKVIFADEPTGNLDKENTKHILKLLTKINQLGTTLLLATHDPYIIKELQAKRIELEKYRQAGNNASDDSVMTKISTQFSESKADQQETEKPQKDEPKKETKKKKSEDELDKKSSLQKADKQKINPKEQINRAGKYFSNFFKKKPNKPDLNKIEESSAKTDLCESTKKEKSE